MTAREKLSVFDNSFKDSFEKGIKIREVSCLIHDYLSNTAGIELLTYRLTRIRAHYMFWERSTNVTEINREIELGVLKKKFNHVLDALFILEQRLLRIDKRAIAMDVELYYDTVSYDEPVLRVTVKDQVYLYPGNMRKVNLK